MGQKVWGGGCCAPFGAELEHYVALAEAYLHTKLVVGTGRYSDSRYFDNRYLAALPQHNEVFTTS